uniref:Uncharacterized protein n=1 Tax=Panagrolaimus davidi TaxID=227884 RepID=A0A914R0H8_9BILA
MGGPENVVKLTQDLMDTLPGEERALLEKYFPIRVQIGGTYFKTYDQAIWREILPDIQERLGTVFSYCVMGEDFEKEFKATLKGVAVLLLAAIANDKEVHVKVCDLQESRE